MRILWLTVDRSNRIAHHFDDFRSTVKDFVSVTEIKKPLVDDSGQNIWRLSHNLVRGTLNVSNVIADVISNSDDFDYIFCDAFFAYMKDDWSAVATTTPTGILIEDVHGMVPRKQVEIAELVGIKHIFHRFNFAFHKFHPSARMKFKCIWLPHSIKMERFTDTIKKTYKVTHTGVYSKAFYPWRYAAIKALKNKHYFTLIKRPRDVPGEVRDNKWPIDRDYDNILKASKVAITDGSILNAPVQKYVEIPASSAVLMSNWFPDLGLMGFKDNENMVSYSFENIVEKVESLLNDNERISRISANALDLISSKHTSEIRAQQFINAICLLTRKPLPYPLVQSCSFNACFDGTKATEWFDLSSPESHIEIPSSNLTKDINLKTIPDTDWRARIRQSMPLEISDDSK